MNITIKSKMKFLYTNLLCSFLFAKNLLFSKKLLVEHFIFITQLTVRGNKTELNWKIFGCHKISINDLPVLPGNISHKNLELGEKFNKIEITFYGVGRQKEIKKIEIETTSPSISNTFKPKINSFNSNSISLAEEDLEKKLDDSFNYLVPLKIKLNNKILYQKLKVSFEPFIKSNYIIKS